MHTHILRVYVGTTTVAGRPVHLWRCADRACLGQVEGPAPLACPVCEGERVIGGQTNRPAYGGAPSPAEVYAACYACADGLACCERCCEGTGALNIDGEAHCPDCVHEAQCEALTDDARAVA